MTTNKIPCNQRMFTFSILRSMRTHLWIIVRLRSRWVEFSLYNLGKGLTAGRSANMRHWKLLRADTIKWRQVFFSFCLWQWDHDQFFLNLLLKLFPLFLFLLRWPLALWATYLQRGERTRSGVKRAVFPTLPHELSSHLLERLCQNCFISRKSSSVSFILTDTSNFF